MGRPTRLLITVDMVNDAFYPTPIEEVIRLLRALADKFERKGTHDGIIPDVNGNASLCYDFVEDEPDEEEVPLAFPEHVAGCSCP